MIHYQYSPCQEKCREYPHIFSTQTHCLRCLCKCPHYRLRKYKYRRAENPVAQHIQKIGAADSLFHSGIISRTDILTRKRSHRRADGVCKLESQPFYLHAHTVSHNHHRAVSINHRLQRHIRYRDNAHLKTRRQPIAQHFPDKPPIRPSLPA